MPKERECLKLSGSKVATRDRVANPASIPASVSAKTKWRRYESELPAFGSLDGKDGLREATPQLSSTHARELDFEQLCS